VETKVIQSFPFEELYNFKKEADSMLGYQIELICEAHSFLFSRQGSDGLFINHQPWTGTRHRVVGFSLTLWPGKIKS
jgi:hypothetical protein